MRADADRIDDNIWITLRRELGNATVCQLCGALGGLQVKVPSGTGALYPEHPLVMALGHDAACAVVACVGGEEFYVRMPLSERDGRAAEAVALMEKGLTNDAIARKMAVSARHVRRILSAYGISNPNRTPRIARKSILALMAAE